MSLMTYTEICELVEQGVIENSKLEYVNGASLDIHMGNSILVENQTKPKIVDLAKREAAPMLDVSDIFIGEGHWDLSPGEVALVETREIFHLPDTVAAEYKLNSSAARAWLNHALAGWADPGFNNATLTLELKNWMQCSRLRLKPGMRIGQMVFWRGAPVPEFASYRKKGNYNNQRGATTSKSHV